jgi:predicted small secreted protein
MQLFSSPSIKPICKPFFLSMLFITMSNTLISGCNTVKGFGQDMQQGGQELQSAAQKDQAHS